MPILFGPIDRNRLCLLDKSVGLSLQHRNEGCKMLQHTAAYPLHDSSDPLLRIFNTILATMKYCTDEYFSNFKGCKYSRDCRKLKTNIIPQSPSGPPLTKKRYKAFQDLSFFFYFFIPFPLTSSAVRKFRHTHSITV